MGIDIALDNKKEAVLPRGEAIGLVILGQINPINLKRDEFSNSPDLLFHGAEKDFVFRRDFKYDQQKNSHSHTVGQGFYATPDRVDAALYSEAFGMKDKPIVVEILPYQARMFDFREASLACNANVPPSLLERYIRYNHAQFNQEWETYNPEADNEFLKTHPPDQLVPREILEQATTFEDMFATVPSPHSEEREIRGDRLASFSDATNYLNVLDLCTGKGIDLRRMLSLVGDPNRSEYASRMFRSFMLSEGYDGVIYIEGGDHPEHMKRKPVSVVFFNVNTIGTFETWNGGEM